MRATVDEVGRALEAEGIDAHWAKGGTVVLARTRAQLARARADVEHARRWGLGEDDVRLLAGQEARSLLAATKVRGATYTPDCAAVHPGRLVAGLAAAVERRGVDHLRAHAGDQPRAGAGPHRPRHVARRRRGAGDRGLHAGACAGAAASSPRSTR